MIRLCAALQSLADEPGRVQMNPADAQRLGIADKQLVWVSSRRGKVRYYPVLTPGKSN
ncbi:hypothetical protein FK521_29310, partial [Klebsiella pneumoniae]|nr:hypothetical protein [Klebsiella pneumoniae]